MLDCWEGDYHRRPTFDVLVKRLELLGEPSEGLAAATSSAAASTANNGASAYEVPVTSTAFGGGEQLAYLVPHPGENAYVQPGVTLDGIGEAMQALESGGYSNQNYGRYAYASHSPVSMRNPAYREGMASGTEGTFCDGSFYDQACEAQDPTPEPPTTATKQKPPTTYEFASSGASARRGGDWEALYDEASADVEQPVAAIGTEETNGFILYDKASTAAPAQEEEEGGDASSKPEYLQLLRAKTPEDEYANCAVGVDQKDPDRKVAGLSGADRKFSMA